MIGMGSVRTAAYLAIMPTPPSSAQHPARMYRRAFVCALTASGACALPLIIGSVSLRFQHLLQMTLASRENLSWWKLLIWLITTDARGSQKGDVGSRQEEEAISCIWRKVYMLSYANLFGTISAWNMQACCKNRFALHASLVEIQAANNAIYKIPSDLFGKP